MVGRILRAATGYTTTLSTPGAIRRPDTMKSNARYADTSSWRASLVRYLQAIASVCFYPQICDLPQREGGASIGATSERLVGKCVLVIAQAFEASRLGYQAHLSGKLRRGRTRLGRHQQRPRLSVGQYQRHQQRRVDL